MSPCLKLNRFINWLRNISVIFTGRRNKILLVKMSHWNKTRRKVSLPQKKGHVYWIWVGNISLAMDHERPLTTSYFFDLRFLPGYLFGIFKLSYWSGTIASCHSPARNVLRVRQGQTKDYEIGVCCFSAKYSPQGVSTTNEWISHVNQTSLSVYVHWFSHVHINYS